MTGCHASSSKRVPWFTREKASPGPATPFAHRELLHNAAAGSSPTAIIATQRDARKTRGLIARGFAKARHVHVPVRPHAMIG